ncbi:MAG TPA: M13 family metallopeptidase [Thermoanaerobaculia bacterium]|nr:M13 family metallopeptidase [Thermoanaerobaculia bacterium]
MDGASAPSSEKDGLKPIATDLERIARAKANADVQAILRDHHREGLSTLFGFDIQPDLRNSDRYIVYAVQGGLGLPDRDYYTREDADSVALREKYRAHIAAMLRLLGDSKEAADASAHAIVALETRLANASLTRVELRDLDNYYNIQTVAKADEMTPRFSWSGWLAHLGLAKLESFSYAHPKFFAEMDRALDDVPLETWKAYLRWNVLRGSAPYLAERFVEENFDFYGRTLRGTKEMRPRWKRVIDQTSDSLGEALGEVYVERAFTPETKARADAMIADLRGAIHGRISNLEWMGDETKKKALEKLGTFVSKIGYPGTWRDYSSLEIGRASYLANVRAANAFEVRRITRKIGQPIDRGEWAMAPQTVNAYYHPLMNEIVFPAAIMQPPFFDGTMDDAVNYGAMGGVIGHEFMHGFDDQGSRFDAKGNMKSWWTDGDRKRFEERAHKLVEQYDAYVAVGDLHVNGKLTLGENIGDLAGITMSYYALQSALKGKERKEIDGFTPEQRFFLSWAQSWRGNFRPEAIRLRVNSDPHSPSMFRTNGPLENMPEFAKAFGCKEGDPMVRPAAQRADIW